MLNKKVKTLAENNVNVIYAYTYWENKIKYIHHNIRVFILYGEYNINKKLKIK
jgi:hypothetical protein